MDRQTRERLELCGRLSLLWDLIPINIEPFLVVDSMPEEMELQEVVRGMHNIRAVEALGIRAEQMKVWLKGIFDKEEKELVGVRDKWRAFVPLIQAI